MQFVSNFVFTLGILFLNLFACAMRFWIIRACLVLDPDESEFRHVPLRKTHTILLDRKHVIEAKLFVSGREQKNVNDLAPTTNDVSCGWQSIKFVVAPQMTNNYIT